MTNIRSKQYPQKVNDWTGVINNKIVGTFFI